MSFFEFFRSPQIPPEQRRAVCFTIWRPGLVLAVLAFAVILTGLSVFKQDPLPWWQSGLWAIAVAAPIPFRLHTGPGAAVWISRACFFLYPLAAFVIVELFSSNDPIHGYSLLLRLLNIAFYYLIALLVYLISGRAKLSAGVTLCFFWAVGMANCYVTRFRGRIIFPSDLRTLGTAANVASNYSLRPDMVQVTLSMITALLILLLILLPRQKKRARLRLRSAIPTGVACAAFLAVFFYSPFLDGLGVKPDMWGSGTTGFVFHFNLCLRYSSISKPDGYSLNAVETIAARVAEEGGREPGALDGQTSPSNLIVIMNEAYSDLSVLGDLETNQDYFPFLHALSENTVKGWAYASVFGGTTANSEYEFLTGHTTAYLPPGCVPYQMYVKQGAASLVSQLNSLGYRSVAMHPFYASGWNRPQVYELFGFSEIYFFEDFQNPAWIRSFVSDQSDYENLVRMVEEKQPGEKLFLFNVTMQNHGSYDADWDNLPREVWLTGDMEGRYPTVDQYLSLVYQSDLALKYLVEYFSQVEEPTMILIFGDHQPQVYGTFYEDMLGVSPDAETAQRRQAIPFLIWANYDIEERDGVVLSLNYLSALLTETANIPQTGYQQFLNQLWETVPVVNAVGFASEDSQWTFREDELSEQAQKSLLEYQMLQYNELFASQTQRMDSFFFLDTEE